MTVLAQNKERNEQLEIVRTNPATGEIVSRERTQDLNSCLKLAARAAAAFPKWSSTATADRAAHLIALAQRIEDRTEVFCDTMIAEIGAPRSWAKHNVAFAAKILRETATYTALLDSPETVPGGVGFSSRVERTPCGVCLGIAPWNAPLILGIRAIAAPLLCGNTVLLKGNEMAPRTYRMIGEAVKAAGFPDDVVTVFLCPPEESEVIVDALIETPVVRRVNFTGSTRVGRRVAELCAKHLKRPLLELGGQAPMLVLDDVDLDVAAEAAVRGAFLNQGQICISTERLIVVDSVADELINRVEARRKALILGNPENLDTNVGPVINISAAERLSELVRDAVSKGAQLVGGGGMRDAFFEPTLVDRVEPDMRLYQEETFGPILAITRVGNDDEAITVANDSEYGLSASVYCNDTARAERVASQVHTGICHINRPTVDDDPNAPFGGVKGSGYGRFGGRWVLDEFTELRWITSALEP